MAQTNQIVPKFSFPYIETVINDYTHRSDETSIVDAEYDDTIRFMFPFVGYKGPDNVFVKKSSLSSFKSTYGNSNYRKYGQPIMMPLNLLEKGNCEVWCMRVMPEDATYANNVISLYYKADSKEDVPTASERKFHIKLKSKTSDTIYSKEDLADFVKEANSGDVSGVDADGYTRIPFMTLCSNGRGIYGNNYRVRVAQNITYERTYGVKFNTYEILTTENSLSKIASYVGASTSTTKYSVATLINDILADTATGVAPVDINVNEDAMDILTEAYNAFTADQLEDLKTERESKAGTADTDTLNALDAMIELATTGIDADAMDPFYGRKLSSTVSLPMLEVDEGVDFSAVGGVSLTGGVNGEFDNPAKYEESVETCYKKAFSGEYDKRILTPRRIQASAIFDANYPFDVKCTMADLAILRNDAICYLDTGIIDSFTQDVVVHLVNDYSVFDNYLISKNLHHYTIYESTTNKRVNVTITYFLAPLYVSHMTTYGTHIPMVKRYAQLSGHIRNTLKPAIEEHETDLKETLTTNRFNFFETVSDNVYQRATQSTSQMSESDLTEESNVTTVYEMKRRIEFEIMQNLYDFSDASVRNGFTQYFKAVFADWVGRKVESFDIDFRMSEWESEHSVMHAYLSVVFRGIFKRAIVEIDINKRDYSAGSNNAETSEE